MLGLEPRGPSLKGSSSEHQTLRGGAAGGREAWGDAIGSCSRYHG